jgi:hypothetical protein
MGVRYGGHPFRIGQLERSGRVKEIYLKTGDVVMVDDEDHEYLSQFKWHRVSARGKHYAGRTVSLPNQASLTILMHRELLGTPKGMFSDHINGETLDNRRVNLRIVTHAQNMRNRKVNRVNKLGYKGVSEQKGKKRTRFIAEINHNGKRRYLGTHDTPELAALAYNRAARDLFGEHANFNNIPGELARDVNE